MLESRLKIVVSKQNGEYLVVYLPRFIIYWKTQTEENESQKLQVGTTTQIVNKQGKEKIEKKRLCPQSDTTGPTRA